MFSKLTLVTLISVVVAAPQHHTAAQFPAGIDPSKCPNFPICDNAALHNQQPISATSAPPSWNSQPQSQWNQPQPQWNQQSQPQWNQPQPQRNQESQSQWNQPQPQRSHESYSQWNQPQQQRNQESQSQWNQPQPQWNQQQSSWNPAPYQPPSNHLSGGDQDSSDLSGTGGDKYPAGVNPQSCPNYPYCDGNAVHDRAIAAPPQKTDYNSGRQYPAGVSPHSCPNFPYCN